LSHHPSPSAEAAGLDWLRSGTAPGSRSRPTAGTHDRPRLGGPVRISQRQCRWPHGRSAARPHGRCASSAWAASSNDTRPSPLVAQPVINKPALNRGGGGTKVSTGQHRWPQVVRSALQRQPAAACIGLLPCPGGSGAAVQCQQGAAGRLGAVLGTHQRHQH
jgi:hypothetical protein